VILLKQEVYQEISFMPKNWDKAFMSNNGGFNT